MSEEDAPRRSGGASAVTGLTKAAARGAAVFLALAAAAELLAAAAWLALGRPYGLRFPAKVGWLYLLSFDRVGVDVRGPAIGPVPPSDVRLHVAALTGTVLAVVLAFLAGRRSGGRTIPERVLRGGAVALGVGVPVSVGASAIRLAFPTASLTIRPVVLEAWLLPTLVALGPAVAGALWSAPPVATSPGPLRRAAAGAVRMLALSGAFAVVGLVGLAALRPDGAGAYARAVTAGGPARSALILGHQAVLLPNQAVDVLTPAMGACDVATGGGGTTELLCFARQPLARLVAATGIAGPAAPAGGSMPAAFFLLVAAPVAATLLAGWRAGAGLPGPIAARTGAAAGLGFGALFGIAAMASTVTISGSLGTAFDGSLSIGPDLPAAALAALAWGVVGGTAGALLAPRPPPDDRSARGGAPG